MMAVAVDEWRVIFEVALSLAGLFFDFNPQV